MKSVTVEGKPYPVVNQIRDDRAIINFDGLFVLVDLTSGNWELSGQTASLEEGKLIQELCAPTNDKTVVTVTKE